MTTLQELRDTLRASHARFHPTLEKLYRGVLEPVLAAAPRARLLYVIPDGALWYFPLESALAPGGSFAVEDLSFVYINAPQELVQNAGRR